MAIGKDILDAVTAETQVVDSFLTLVQGLIDNNTVSPADGAAILAAINSEKDKVAAAIAANTPAGTVSATPGTAASSVPPSSDEPPNKPRFDEFGNPIGP